MNNASPPNGPGDLDRHLSKFFKSQVPTPFPPAPEVGFAEPIRTTAAGSGVAGRLTLALSVAALGGLALWATGGFVPSPAGGSSAGSGAPSLLKNAEASGAKSFPQTAPTGPGGMR